MGLIITTGASRSKPIKGQNSATGSTSLPPRGRAVTLTRLIFAKLCAKDVQKRRAAYVK